MALFNYECDEVKRIIEEVSPNYPQLTTYEKEWLYFHKYGYIPGVPVELEYETINVNPTGMVSNAIPFQYKSAILKGNTDENLQSVKMPVLTTTGKNLFDKEKHKLKPNYGAPETYYGTDYIKVKPLTTYTRNNQTSLSCYTNYGDTTMVFSTTSTTFTTTAETNYIRYNVLKTEIDTHQLEEGSTATSYEPYQSNSLTVNEEVELCGIGEVKDELDLLSGKLTQRIGETVLDGSEGWKISTTKENTQVFNLPTNNSKLINVKKNTPVLCNQLKTTTGVDEEIINLTTSLYIGLLKSKASTVSELKQYLSQNPITFRHQLITESVKTVDLTPLDKPYEGTNHYELTSNIPCEAILEVPVVSIGKQTLKEIND